MNSTQVTFDLPDTASEVEFLHEYMVPAWERFREDDAFESGWFWRSGNFAQHDVEDLTRDKHDLERLEPGMIVFVINGEPERLLDTEREHWEAFARDGLLEGWETQSYSPQYENAREKMREKYGREGGDRAYKLRQIAAEMTIDLLAAFDQPLPAIGTPSDENPVPVGFWTMTHFLMKHQGYDWYQEIDACSMSIRNRLHSLAVFMSPDEAQETLDEVIEELRAVRAELDE
jgi:hypothetical protein